MTIVLITHEMDVIRVIADRVVVMEGGRVIESGSAFDVLSAPQHPATARFVASVIDEVPRGADLAALRARHDGRIVTLDVREGEGSAQAEVFATLAAHGVRFEVVHGGINDIHGRVFGHLTLALTGEADAVERALAAASTVARLTEEDTRG